MLGNRSARLPYTRAKGEDIRKRDDNSPTGAGDGPGTRHDWGGEDNHHSDRQEGDENREPESLEDLRNFLEEVGELDFLLGGCPRHVVGEKMSEHRSSQMETQSTEEEAEPKV